MLKSGITTPETLIFNETSFNLLMQQRISTVLLICSSYDAYMLEEDGRIDEQIFNEYVSLNLRLPPHFVHTDSAKMAFKILESEKIDLVIEMLSIPDIDTFELANLIKQRYNSIPIVVLTHFSREVSIKLKNEDLKAVDYVFCWLGNANLLLTIIKLIEDKMNAEHDIEVIGVQTILLLEDSIRFTSIYLPDLYKIIFKQSQEFVKEALNEHQQMLRMRGRPKILLATTYNEAVDLYNRYKHNMLGIISDINIREDHLITQKLNGGIQLCSIVKSEDPYMPFVFQSSDIENMKVATTMGVGFIHKYSKTLSHDLKKYIVSNFGFGDFIFRNPTTMNEIARASDLTSLHQLIHTIPEDSLIFHTSRNELSKWLNARSLFPIAQMFKDINLSDFNSTEDGRQYICKAIGEYRLSRARGVIARFSTENIDDYLIFSRIGEGSVGGKARGLVFLSALLKKYSLYNLFPDVAITIPRSVVLTTDIFEDFMETNNLYKVGLSNISDEDILRAFVNSELSSDLISKLKKLLLYFKNPIAIRSSSKLEDSQFQPFAGIYSTYMIPNVENDPELTLKYLMDAIKAVYASAYFKNSKAYMAATSNVIDEEMMGIILQEVCGNQYNEYFYPTGSGVARSINYYPIRPEKANDGIVNVAFGLGKLVVDGGASLRFSPKYPKNILQLSTPESALKETQKIYYALNLGVPFEPSTDENVNLSKLKISNIENNPAFKYVSSTYDFENNIVRDGDYETGKKIITFSNILQHNIFPMAEILDTILEIGQQEMGSPVEIEFAINLDVPEGKPKILNLLQIRPIVLNDQRINFTLNNFPEDKTIITSYMALGNGSIENMSDIIYIKPDNFKASTTKQIAISVEALNNKLQKANRNYILIGPGRWGSSDPSLGIPIKWPQISEARVIVESGLQDYRIDPSQGTHFFQNLTSFRVGYFTINPYLKEGFYDIPFLTQQSAIFEDEFLRHIYFEKPLKVYIDGKINKGIILKPGISL